MPWGPAGEVSGLVPEKGGGVGNMDLSFCCGFCRRVQGR